MENRPTCQSLSAGSLVVCSRTLVGREDALTVSKLSGSVAPTRSFGRGLRRGRRDHGSRPPSATAGLPTHTDKLPLAYAAAAIRPLRPRPYITYNFSRSYS